MIEPDGNQHFEQVGSWGSPEEHRERDHFKMNLALENGYSIIRILQVDVWEDKNDWKNKLIEAITRVYKKPKIVYLYEGKEKEFHNFIHN